MNPFNLDFQYPYFLLLLLIVLIYGALKVGIKRKKSALNVPSLTPFEIEQETPYKYGFASLTILRMITMACLIIAIARPRESIQSQEMIHEQGIDILMVVDVSLSMLSKDFDPDRITALKEVAGNFVKGRKTDRIGILAYAAEAITKVPLTTDKEILTKEIANLSTFELEQGTAIGVGLATGINHLKDSKAKSKVIILLTDGENNSGNISPEIAADIAKEKGIKVYTIGIGTKGEALSPVGVDLFNEIIFRKMKTNLDVDLLKSIANKTGGKFYRATNKKLLSQVYDEINELEKTNINDNKFLGYLEKYKPFVWVALFAICLELLLRTFIFKSIND